MAILAQGPRPALHGSRLMREHLVICRCMMWMTVEIEEALLEDLKRFGTGRTGRSSLT